MTERKLYCSLCAKKIQIMVYDHIPLRCPFNPRKVFTVYYVDFFSSHANPMLELFCLIYIPPPKKKYPLPDDPSNKLPKKRKRRCKEYVPEFTEVSVFCVCNEWGTYKSTLVEPHAHVTNILKRRVIQFLRLLHGRSVLIYHTLCCLQ